LVGVTQPDGAAGWLAAGAAFAPPVGATQLLGADAVGAGAPVGAPVGAAADALDGVDCSLANRPDDGLPSTGMPLACSKLEIAPRVFGPM
jgi:hypothetical protein